LLRTLYVLWFPFARHRARIPSSYLGRLIAFADRGFYKKDHIWVAALQDILKYATAVSFYPSYFIALYYICIRGY
jgi:hypothetical protein